MMKKYIKINDRLVSYLYKKNRRSKRIKISYCRRLGLIITVPWFVNRWMAESFILKSSDWISQTIEKAENSLSVDIFLDKKYQDYKEQARKYILDRLEYYSSLLDLSFGKVFIKNQSKVWGSCSSKKNLNFNYRLLFLEKELSDYIVVHELCHLREMNHSDKFWSLVKSILPDYERRRRDLKKMFF